MTSQYINNENDCTDDDGFCIYCRWNSCYPQSHIEYSMNGYGINNNKPCDYIQKKYEIWITEDGELEWKLKTD